MLRFLRENVAILIILLFGLIIRILLSHTLTYTQDLYTFQLWSLNLVQHGFSNFYSTAIANYLPGYLYVLLFLGKVFYWFLNHKILLPIDLVYKSPSIITDLANVLLIYFLADKIVSKKVAIITSFIAAVNLALLANSTFWGQVDSFVSFFLLLSLILILNKKYSLSAISLGFAQVTKPVGFLLLPIYLLWMYQKGSKLSQLIIYISIATITVVTLFLPFYSSGNFLSFIFSQYSFTRGFFPYMSFNAFNLWGFLTALYSTKWDGVSDQIRFIGLTYQNWGYLIFSLSYLFLTSKLYGKIKTVSYRQQVFFLILTISLVYFSFFLFFTRLHERHLYYGLIFLNIIILFFKDLWRKIVVSIPFIIYLLNLYFAYWKSGYSFVALPIFLYFLLPLLLLVSFIYLLKYGYD